MRHLFIHMTLMTACLLVLAGSGQAAVTVQQADESPVVQDALSMFDIPLGLMADDTLADLLSEPLPGREGDQARPQGQPGTGEFRLSASNRLEFHARDIDVADAFVQLRTLVQRNIVLAPGIAARFTGDLYDLDVEETIDAVCRSTGLVARYEGSFVYIEPDELTSRVFELQYVRGEDLVRLIEPMLSANGSATATAPSQTGITPSQEEAGGDGYAFSDVLLVYDFPSVLDAVGEVVQTLDVRPRQVLIEATILSAELNDEFAAGIDFNLLQGVNFKDVGSTSADGTSIDYGGFSGTQLKDGTGSEFSNLNELLPTGGLNVGFAKYGAGVFIKALEQVTDTTILANPRVIAVNKQRGEVLLGRRDGFLTSIVTQTSTTQRVEYLETGTRLVFRAFIGDDEYVRLEIHPEDSDGGVNADGLPFKETAEVTTNVMVRSGDTVVLGGLFRERMQTIEKKIPLLGDVPFIGNIFRSQNDVSKREEIIVMLTPHILDPAESLLDPSLTVAGLVPRGALAGAYVYTARALMAKGDHAGALMFLEAGRELDPLRAEVMGLERDVFAGIVPAFADRSIDDLILDEMMLETWDSPQEGAR